ncbi:MAG: phosphomethylpyrimidine synthase ThiC [Thermoplasmata archaeon]|nr:phosphomethylpyrimidine synthase ThiC [Thermoplasmata archaeon]
MTQMDAALRGEVTEEMAAVAADEGMAPGSLRRLIASGRAVIPANVHHDGLRPVGIGEGLRTKINSNIGTSVYDTDMGKELEKLRLSRKLGADALMDLSTAGDLGAIRARLLGEWDLAFGTVPIYQAMAEAGDIADVTAERMLRAIEDHARDGVDFVTVHSGVTLDAIPLVRKRILGAVSRGGAFLLSWMMAHGEQNPLNAEFDAILEMAREHDVTLSLGDGLRPGGIPDNTDEAQLHELRVLGGLTRRARAAGVQVIIEGPGHIPLHRVVENVRLEKEACDGAPFYVLGPLVTDIAMGHDHITAAIGAAVAGAAGADFLCYVTPAEHLRLPEPEDVAEGVIALKIAAHAADIAKGVPGAYERDLAMTKARRDLDWEAQMALALDPDKARRYREESHIKTEECTMCGPYCAIKMFRGGC